MIDYSDTIKAQRIIYKSEDYVLCHPLALPNHINAYHLCTWKPVFSNREKTSWLCCGTWYLRDDGKYHDSANGYGSGLGLGVVDTIQQIAEKLRNR